MRFPLVVRLSVSMVSPHCFRADIKISHFFTLPVGGVVVSGSVSSLGGRVVVLGIGGIHYSVAFKTL
jgi:hypothetical protein